ncbi:mediator of replication checkpoint protein [Acrasis kona]|uniref:Mediator of replication checkpoint protein n=1 Tax=Acrasis kona TaxID=1008807 RepID=A0AAW2ZBE7_9EUKA
MIEGTTSTAPTENERPKKKIKIDDSCTMQPSIDSLELYRLDGVDPSKTFEEWTKEEEEIIIREFRGRGAINCGDVGDQQKKWNFELIREQVYRKIDSDKAFEEKLDPYVCVCAFGGGPLGGASPPGFAAAIAASPFNVCAPMNGSDFVYGCPSREVAIGLQGYLIGLGHHAWVFTHTKPVYM